MLGGLLALLSMVFLGFADDILDIPWRNKLYLPYIASMPLLMVYFITYNNTSILIPLPLRPYFSKSYFDLGAFYYVYISTIVAFSTNSINILAGVNGAEAAQAIVIACSLSINNVILGWPWPSECDHLGGLGGSVCFGYTANLYSLYMLLPFIGVSLGFLRRNWYPAQCFGGDTFTYFAGYA